MSQPPNPPSGSTPPAGWNPNWGSDPTQQLPAGQQYPPTQQFPAGEQFPGGAQYPGQQYGQNAPGQYPAGGQGGQFGQAPAGGQFGQNPGGGQYGPPGGNFGAPPNGGGFVPPTGGSGGGRNPAPLIIASVAGVLVIGLLVWYLFLRPSTTAAPNPTPTVAVPSSASPSAPPSVLITPSASPSQPGSESPSASPRPSGTTTASCSAQLSKTQCEWAVYLKKFVAINSCTPDSSDARREAFTCAVNARGKVSRDATVSLRWADDAADLTKLMDGVFSRSGVAKSKIGKNWKNPPALTNWWYTDKPKEILGKLGSATAKDGSAHVAWTFSKQRFFIEASSDSDNAATMIDWWAKT